MGFLFNHPDPKQAVPQDLGGLRSAILQAILGIGGGGAASPQGRSPGSAIGLGGFPGLPGMGVAGLGGQPQNQRPGGPAQYLGSSGKFGGSGQGGVLGALLGLTNSQTPGGDVLGPLSAVFNQNLNDQISGLNASSPGRFSTANLYEQSQLRQRSMNDYNLLASQVLEQGRQRQLQAIMALLGPVLGPTFGGPFTQEASPWENVLGGAQTVAGFLGGGTPKKG